MRAKLNIHAPNANIFGHLSQIIKAIKQLEFDEYASAAFEAKKAAEQAQKFSFN